MLLLHVTAMSKSKRSKCSTVAFLLNCYFVIFCDFASLSVCYKVWSRLDAFRFYFSQCLEWVKARSYLLSKETW